MANWITFKRMIVAALLCAGLAGIGGVCAIGGPEPNPSKSTPAREVWQKEFDSVCFRTQEAMNFSEEELATLVKRCDALLPQLEKLDETRKKVYMGRLRMCRGLYAYVLESKRNEKK
jgi:hypothetical protein